MPSKISPALIVLELSFIWSSQSATIISVQFEQTTLQLSIARLRRSASPSAPAGARSGGPVTPRLRRWFSQSLRNAFWSNRAASAARWPCCCEGVVVLISNSATLAHRGIGARAARRAPSVNVATLEAPRVSAE